MWLNSKSGSVVAGNVTKDPEYKRVGKNNMPLFKLSVAIGKDEQGNKKYADIAAWGRLAERLSEYAIRKGDPVTVFGVWEKKESNIGKVYWTLNADFVCAFNNRAVITDEPNDGFEDIGMPDGIDFGELPDFMR
jgi:hypothetical protein